MQVPYSLDRVWQLARDHPEDPPYTALFYDPIDIALQRPNNEALDERHGNIRSILLSRHIHAARDLFLSTEIKLLNRHQGFLIHSAFTVQVGPFEDTEKLGQGQLEDTYAEFEALKDVDGCLMVVKNRSPKHSAADYAAVWGGIMSNATRGLGCAGVVTNGNVRDSHQLSAVADDFNYLVFGRGFCPLDARGTVQLDHFMKSISMPGLQFDQNPGHQVSIDPGDCVVADRDGILVIPQAIAQDVIDLSVERYEAEAYVIRGIRNQKRSDVIPFIRKNGIL
jgi:regulator of RNase E activity RraA